MTHPKPGLTRGKHRGVVSRYTKGRQGALGMRRVIGVVLIVVGMGWAGLGAWSCQSALEPNLDDQSDSANMARGVVSCTSMSLFVLPGLLLCGVGAIAYGGGARKAT